MYSGFSWMIPWFSTYIHNSVIVVIGHNFFTCFSSPASFLSSLWDSDDTHVWCFVIVLQVPEPVYLGLFSLWCLCWVISVFYLQVRGFFPLPPSFTGEFTYWFSKKFWLVSAFFTSKFPFDVPSISLLRLYVFFIFFKCVHDSLVKHFCDSCHKIIVR